MRTTAHVIRDSIKDVVKGKKPRQREKKIPLHRRTLDSLPLIYKDVLSMRMQRYYLMIHVLRPLPFFADRHYQRQHLQIVLYSLKKKSQLFLTITNTPTSTPSLGTRICGFVATPCRISSIISTGIFSG